MQHVSGFCTARQMAAAPSDAISGASNGLESTQHGAIGISAFAFQGTNAHVLVAAAAAAAAAEISFQPKWKQEAAWQRRRYWYAPEPSALLAAVVVAAGSSSGGGTLAVFSLHLQAPSSTYMRDHQVSLSRRRNTSWNGLLMIHQLGWSIVGTSTTQSAQEPEATCTSPN